MLKRFLITPGPTPVPPEVLLAGAEPIVHHRAPRFVEIFNEMRRGPEVRLPDRATTCSSSPPRGTGAMEAAVVNVVNPGDTVIVASVGNFGERWVKLASKWGAEVVALDFEWGTKADPAAIAKALADAPRGQGRLRAVLRDLHRRRQRHQGDRRDRRRARRPSSSSTPSRGLGATDLPTDEWKVDVCVAGSQKALMIPPGLAMVAVSDKAWKVVEAVHQRRASTSTGSRTATRPETARRRSRRPSRCSSC